MRRLDAALVRRRLDAAGVNPGRQRVVARRSPADLMSLPLSLPFFCRDDGFPTAPSSRRGKSGVKPPHSGDLTVRLADEAACTRAEGPGKRCALWFQGCSLRCPGCANPGMLDPAGGYETTVGAVAARLREARDRHGLRGVTLLGGEPFDQPEALRGLVAAARGLGLDVLLFTGHTLEALRARRDPVTEAVLALTDALVDGPYLAARHTNRLYLRGSDNQRIHLLGTGFGPDDLTGPNRLEVRIRDGEAQITGFPGLLVSPESLSQRRKGTEPDEGAGV